MRTALMVGSLRVQSANRHGVIRTARKTSGVCVTATQTQVFPDPQRVGYLGNSEDLPFFLKLRFVGFAEFSKIDKLPGAVMF